MTANLSAIVGRRRQAALRLVAAGSLAALLAGCYQHQQVAEERYPQDYRERHPITLQEGERSVEIFLGSGRGGLNAAQRADVLAFAQLWRREATGGILVDVPSGRSTERAAAESLHEIQSMFAASGVPQGAIYAHRYRLAPAALPSIRLNYSKLVAKAGPCGQWPKDLGPAAGLSHLNNEPYWNLGCATQRNLASMVSNPTDLVQPRVDQPTYEARRTTVLEHYRKGESPSATYTGYDAGKISDLGK